MFVRGVDLTKLHLATVLGNWMLNHHNNYTLAASSHAHLILGFNATDCISHCFIEACQRSRLMEILINEHDEDIIHWQWLKCSV